MSSPHNVMHRLWRVVALACVAASARAQVPETLDLSAVGKNPRWRVAGRTATQVEIDGRHALHLDEGPGNGVVWLDGYSFTNGVIEADIKGRSQPVQGSFVGVAFRVVDGETHDAVYFRPFNFQASDSTRHSHAVQYVSHPRWPWDTLRAAHPGVYEKAVVPGLDGDQWFHVRIVVRRPTVTVFVNGRTTPCLVVNELSDRASGSVGVWVGNMSPGDFANLRVTKTP